jgi:hypothetical protein
MYLRITITFVLLFSIYFSNAQPDSTNVSVNGQITSWGLGQIENPTRIQLGARFVPSLSGKLILNPKSKIDFEGSVNMNGSANFTGLQYDSVNGQFKPYRVWVRYCGSNWEIRTGLQQINFGSAKLFRPLMWFDGLDARDPLKLTDGVYGILSRYYFQNNANIWLWVLIGNKNPKGFETIGSAQWKPEIGGRFQIPFGPGQLALSTNYRMVDTRNSVRPLPENVILKESRIGLDGKWDLGIGLWFESSVTKLEANPDSIAQFQDAWNLGADYTFGIGNGLGMTVEYFRYHLGDRIFTKGNTLNLVGSLFTYPVSVFDNLSAMVFYVPRAKLVYNYISWSRTYDNWSFYAIGFWNPANYQLVTSQSQGKNLFAGKGIQLIVNFNF